MIVVLLNYSVSETLSYSPAELFLGGIRRNPILEHFGIPTSEQPTWKDKLVCATRRNQILKRRRNQKLARKGPKVQIGELVFLKIHKISSAAENLVKKFFNLYAGPYYVKSQAGLNTFLLVDCTTGKQTVAQHVENLRVWQCFPEKKDHWIHIMNTQLNPEASTSGQ